MALSGSFGFLSQPQSYTSRNRTLFAPIKKRPTDLLKRPNSSNLQPRNSPPPSTPQYLPPRLHFAGANLPFRVHLHLTISRAFGQRAWLRNRFYPASFPQHVFSFDLDWLQQNAWKPETTKMVSAEAGAPEVETPHLEDG